MDVTALLRGRLRVVLAPEAVELVLLSAGLRPRIAHAVRHPVAPVRAAADGAPWRAAVDVLAAALAEPRWQGAPAQVLVSEHWVRWQLIPFSESLTRDPEIESYARMEFEAVHGERSRGWQVSVAAPRAGQAVPACAVDAALPEAVRAACEGAGVKLASFTTRFAQACERHRHRIGAGAGALAWVEPGRCTLGVFEDGAWRGIASPRVNGDAVAVLGAELAATVAGGAVAGPGTLHLAFAAGRRAMPVELGGWRVSVLDEPALAFAVEASAPGLPASEGALT
jgi:hypothetical protein